MSRLVPAATALLLFAAAAPAADSPAGSWKLTMRTERQPILLLVAFSQAGGKWVGDFIDATARFPQDPKVTAVEVTGDALKFSLSLGGQPLLTFDGVVAKDGKKIAGSVSQGGGPLELTELRPSTLKKLNDPFEIVREQFAQTDDAQGAFDAATLVLGQAAAKGMKPDEARGVVDKVARLAAGYGPRWERTVALRCATLLAGQPGFEEVALAQARRAERMLTDEDDPAARLDVLETLAGILTRAKKPDEAKKYLAQIAKVEARDYQEYAKTSPPFKPEPFKGRKGTGDRVVLVELFTNADLGPTAAFDLAGDALAKAYPPKDAIVLSYHFNQPNAADPLASPDVQKRVEQYAEWVEKGSFSFVAGKPAVRALRTMTAAASKEVFDSLRQLVDTQLEKPAGVNLKVSAAPAEKGFAVKAVYSDLQAPGDKMMLRFAVVEDRVRYAGGNGIRYHHNVVRALPGGVKGFALKAKAGEQAVTVDPAEIRAAATRSLDEFAKESEAARPDRLVALKNLTVVAFVQNDATNEILTAARVALDGKKE